MKNAIIVFLILCFLGGCVSNKDNKPQEFIAKKSNNTQQKNAENSEEQFNIGKQKFDNKIYREAIQWLLKAAKQNHSLAQAYLGMMYSSDQYGTKQDDQQSAYWYKKAAENGNSVAQFNIAGWYRIGTIEFPQSSILAAKWYLKAAEQGDNYAQSLIGEMYWSGEGVPQNYTEAVKWHKKSVQQKHDRQVVSQFRLGVAYNQGLGVVQNTKTAISWFLKAATQGDGQSQETLGMIYGKLTNYEKSIEWHKKAAEQDSYRSQFSLGLYYQYGKGVKCNFEKALEWYRKAAKHGHKQAQKQIVIINKAKIKLEEILKSAEEGKKWAPYELGVEYYFGQSACKDMKKAVYWFEKSAGVAAMAPFYLGEIYYYGKGWIVQDLKKAVYWYKIAANDNVKWAQAQLGEMYYNGVGVTQNFILAYVWESLAAANGIESAKNNRDITAQKLSQQQLSEAQEIATKIQYKINHRSESQNQESSIVNTEKKINGSGTGFIITRDGYILTCHHVIEKAKEIKIIAGGNTYSAKLVRDDPNNDLALLKINGKFSALAFSSKRSAKMGQEVFTIGFPNPGLQGVSAKFTDGAISSLTGFQDDLRLYQVSVPVQPGNSGGALVDKNGNILGVIMAMLDAKTTFKISGSMPQNVNYAVKSIYAQAMLDSLPEISNKLVASAKNKTNAVERVKNSTVMVLSYE